MDINKNQIKHLTYLVGYHLFKPDFNIKEISGKLLNELDEILDMNFQKFDLDENLFILKSNENPLFEFRFQDRALIYEDTIIDSEIFHEKAIKILKLWQDLNPKAQKLKLAGIRRRFQLEIEKPNSKYHTFLYDNFIKNLNLHGKKKKVAFYTNYLCRIDTENYNININMDEFLEKKYVLEFKVDVNQIDEEMIGDITNEKVIKIFNSAKKYYNESFFDLLGINIK